MRKKKDKTEREEQVFSAAEKESGRQRSNEEQMRARQSAPRPEILDYAERETTQETQSDAADGRTDPAEAMGEQARVIPDGFSVLAQKIGREQVREATQILNKYKQGKANLERRIIDNEQWYKLRHWECMRGAKETAEEVEPTSAWLFNCLANKHADAMDNFPSPNILPREEGDKGEAKMLSAILPVVLEQNDFEKTYDEYVDYKNRSGTGVYGCFWDSSKLNGLGDISIVSADLLTLFWQPGITDIQKSPHFFSVELVDNELLLGKYPQLAGKLGSSTLNIAQYVYDDSVDTSNMSAVVDWYYKKYVGGKTVLHYVKYVNDEVLAATENDPRYATRGIYDHGMYPYFFDPLFRTAGTPCGFGYIDIGKNAQMYIDRGNQAIMKNMLANAKPRFFISSSGSVKEEEYADTRRDFVHVEGAANLTTDSIMPINGKTLGEIYVAVIDKKIDELKETTGNRDISTGGTTSGVTAASAIAAMQEAGSKLSRDSNKAAYRVYKSLCMMVIELIRQFYDMPRKFRIMGENGMAEYISYSNEGIKPQPQGSVAGVDMGVRLPQFDIEVSAQKASPYSKLSNNELALQFFGAGFFNPQLADQALACLDMMDFDRKQFVMQRIAQNGGMYQQILAMQQQMVALAQMVDKLQGTNLAQQLALGGAAPQVMPGRVENTNGKEQREEPTHVKKARERVAEGTSPT